MKFRGNKLNSKMYLFYNKNYSLFRKWTKMFKNETFLFLSYRDKDLID
jgi:hypothetical protein